MSSTTIDWHEQAACVGEDPERFFPVGRDALLAEPAKQVCRRCPALRDCLAYALLNAVAGVWGGTTEAEREELRTRHRIAPHPVTLHLVEDATATQVAELSRGGGVDCRDLHPARHRTPHRQLSPRPSARTGVEP